MPLERKMESPLQWKPYLDYYRVSEKGDVYSEIAQINVKYTVLNGTKTVHLTYRGKNKKVKIHKIVAELFVPNEKRLKHIIFINEDLLDTDFRNLKWSATKKAIPEVEWIQLKNYEHNYEINSILGVRNVKTGNILELTKERYPRVQLVNASGEKHKHSIHILMAVQFIPNPDNLPVVNHRDNNPANWKLENLEWATQAQNIKHFHDLNLEKVPKRGHSVRELDNAGEIICIFPSLEHLAKELGVSSTTVSRNIKAKTKIKGRFFELNKKDFSDEKWIQVNTPFDYVNQTYEVSNYGRVRRIGTEMVLNPCLCDKGYLKVTLCGSEPEKVHALKVSRLVAFSFTGSKEFEKEVDHRNKIKTDNRLENLKILDTEEHNSRDHGKAVIGVHKDTAKIIAFRSRKEAGNFFEIYPSGISESVIQGRCAADHYWFDANSSNARDLLELSNLVLITDEITKHPVLRKK